MVLTSRRKKCTPENSEFAHLQDLGSPVLEPVTLINHKLHPLDQLQLANILLQNLIGGQQNVELGTSLEHSCVPKRKAQR